MSNIQNIDKNEMGKYIEETIHDRIGGLAGNNLLNFNFDLSKLTIPEPIKKDDEDG